MVCIATYTPVLEKLDHVLAHLDVIIRFVPGITLQPALTMLVALRMSR